MTTMNRAKPAFGNTSRGLCLPTAGAEYERTYVLFEDYVIECEIYGLNFGDTNVKPVVDFMCPRCGGQLKIDGEHKQISVEKISPKTITLLDGRQVVLDVLISVSPFVCPTPAVNGKAICGLRLVIKDGIASRV